MHALQVTANDLNRWADSLGARGELPRLIRRLILATGKPARVDFPAGELTDLAGWDGILAAPEATNAYLPAGRSCWELSTEKNPGDKATRDYRKRTKETAKKVRAETSYVAVSLRNWPGRRKWEQVRRLKGDWRDVRTLDAGDLETWLDSAPGEALRLGLLLNKTFPGVQTLEGWWEGWRFDTRPALAEAVLVAGRDEEIRAIGSWLTDESAPQTLGVWAGTDEEALATVACALLRLPPIPRDAWFSRAIVVKNAQAWDQLVARPGPLLLLPAFREGGSVGEAIRQGHRIISACGNATRQIGNDRIVLPRLDRNGLRQALEGIGIPAEKSDELARLGRGNLQALRRELGHRAERLAPPWATRDVGRRLAAALLIGQWDDGNAIDRELVSAIAGEPYEKLEADLSDAAALDEPPVLRSGLQWYFPARRDTWRLLAHRITRAELKRFSDAVLEFVPKPDPRWELPAAEWWKAAITVPKGTCLSPQARHGLIEALALLVMEAGPEEGPGVARGAIHGVLQACKASWKTCATLGRGLTDLAELAPEDFLAMVETSLEDAASEILKLFGHDREGGDPFGGVALHTDLLWALEKLAWSPRYLARVVEILGALARHDPGGRYMNRPAASLANVFCPWLPQTSATVGEREAALDVLQRSEPVSTFRLLLGVLPSRAGQAVMLPSVTPRWQNWQPSGRQVSFSEYDAVVSDSVHRLVALAFEDASRWPSLLERLDAVPTRSRPVVMTALKSAANGLALQVRDAIWTALRELVNTHRQFTTAKWALSASELSAVEALLPLFEPEDRIARGAWLFAQNPRIGMDLEWEEEQAELDRRRREVVAAIIAEQGLEGVLRLAGAAEMPGFVGQTLGRLRGPADLEEAVLCHVGIDPGTPDMLLQGFIGGRLETQGDAWRDETLNRLRSNWPSERVALVHAMGAPGSDTWDRVAAESEEIQRAYWRRFLIWGLGQHASVTRPARELLRFGEHQRALALLGLYADKMADEDLPLAVEALERTMTGAPAALSGIRHDIVRLLSRLARSESQKDRLATYEWMLLPLVIDAQEYPLVLYEKMAMDPGFFAELCEAAFRGKEDPPPILSEGEKQRALQAYRLLDSWHGPPGAKSLPELTYRLLSEWVAAAQARLRASGRGVIGDLKIGESIGLAVLSEQGGKRPHPAVVELLEAVRSDDIERGIELRIVNSRGVYSPSAGRAERAQVEAHRRQADELRSVSPRTAGLFDRLADKYEAWAKREEIEHEQEQDT